VTHPLPTAVAERLPACRAQGWTMCGPCADAPRARSAHSPGEAAATRRTRSG